MTRFSRRTTAPTPDRCDVCAHPEQLHDEEDPRMTPRCAIWQCERCTAYHIGGLDITDAGRDGIRAVCGAEWTPDSGPDCELWEIPMVAVPVRDDGENDEQDTSCHCGHPECGAC